MEVKSGDCMSVIGSYLPVSDLKAYIQTCGKMRLACDRPAVWRCAFLAKFFGDFSMFSQGWSVRPDYRQPWKRLAFRSIALEHSGQLAATALGLNGFRQSKLWTVLISPELPILSLKRSAEVTDSFYLGLLADSENSRRNGSEGEFEAEIKAVLDEKALELYAETSDLVQFAQALAGTPGQFSSRILAFYRYFLAALEFHCVSTATIIQEAASDLSLLQAYVERWNGYCSAVQALSNTFQSLFDMIAEMAEARFGAEPPVVHRTVIAAMERYWKQCVFAVVQTRLHTATERVLLEVLTNGANIRCDAVETVKCLLEAVMDISTDAKFCHFVSHSMYKTKGPYAWLEEKAVSTAVRFFSEGENDPVHLRGRVEKAEKALKFMFFPCTIAKLDCELLEIEFSLARSFFRRQIQAFSHCSSEAVGTETVLFASLLGLEMSLCPTVQQFIACQSSECQAYIASLGSRLHTDTESLRDLQLELRKSKLGLTISEVVVY